MRWWSRTAGPSPRASRRPTRAPGGTRSCPASRSGSSREPCRWCPQCAELIGHGEAFIERLPAAVAARRAACGPAMPPLTSESVPEARLPGRHRVPAALGGPPVERGLEVAVLEQRVRPPAAASRGRVGVAGGVHGAHLELVPAVGHVEGGRRCRRRRRRRRRAGTRSVAPASEAKNGEVGRAGPVGARRAGRDRGVGRRGVRRLDGPGRGWRAWRPRCRRRRSRGRGRCGCRRRGPSSPSARCRAV